ncbi:SH3 domain-containing protein [Limimaricola pyoseonensis]|uniref:SH3 domain-containing protein n=1 Tax=Limimaricola pyoseonensis TaxID=521013 RepID=A0A1G7E505_9RHOB|nr:SH3 domain-containing protein [Limimaricola pyoseonensis]SDE58679.1 SH3 domain-containing protein [Limimaricola pyoseonensis]
MKHVLGISATFLLLGVGYYQMSGGADFKPQTMAMAAQVEADKPDILARGDVERTESGIPVTAMREFPENVELISASFMPKPAAEPEPAETAEQTAAAAPAASDAPLDLRLIAGDWVNMRQGPGTSHSVLDTLPRGTEAKVLESAGGWARIEITATGETGWMSERLLAPAEG